MNKFLAVALLLSLNPVMAQESAERYMFRSPQRLVGAYRVDLSSLFRWWTNAEAVLRNTSKANETNREAVIKSRPLSAWIHLTGSMVAEEAQGWKVTALIEDLPEKTAALDIFLLHPPTDESSRFYSLHSRLAPLQNVESRSLNAASANENAARENGSRADTLSLVGRSSDLLAYQVAPQQQAYDRAASQAITRQNLMMRQATIASFQISDVNKQLSAMPPGSVYKIDFFAMKTGQTFNGLPVYDLGLMILQ